MTFAIYALLGNALPIVSAESLAADLERYFRNEENFSIRLDQLPFAKDKSISLRWNTWLTRVSYEQGHDIAQDSEEISRILDEASSPELAKIDRRIRVVFGDDADRAYTNQIIYIMDFLRAMPGVVMFDPQKKDLIK